VTAGAAADANVMVRAADALAGPLGRLSRPAISVTLTGDSALWANFNSANRSAMLRSEMLSWPVTMIILVIAFGSLVANAERIGAELDATVVNMRYVKPIDEDLIARVAAQNPHIVTLEENVVAGGAGSAVGEVLAALGAGGALLHIGIPDRPIQHGTRDDCLADAGLDLGALRARIDAWWRPMRPQMADAAR